MPCRCYVTIVLLNTIVWFRGDVARDLGLFERAIHSFESALNLLESHEPNQEQEEVKGTLSDAQWSELDPISTKEKALLGLGATLMEKQDWTNAESAFQRALQINSKCEAAYFQVGASTQFILVWQTLIVVALHLHCSMQLGVINIRRGADADVGIGGVERAKEYWQNALLLNPKDRSTIFNLGEWHFHRGACMYTYTYTYGISHILAFRRGDLACGAQAT